MTLQRPSINVDASALRNNSLKYFILVATLTLTHNLQKVNSSYDCGIKYLYKIWSKSFKPFRR